MSSMKADLITRLTADATIAAITSSRVQWYERGRGDAAGEIVMNIVSYSRDWSHDGPDWLDRPRVRFDLYHTSPVTLDALRNAVIAEMEIKTTTGDTIFHPAQLEAERTIDLGEQDGGVTYYQLQLEFLFYHEEA